MEDPFFLDGVGSRETTTDDRSTGGVELGVEETPGVLSGRLPPVYTVRRSVPTPDPSTPGRRGLGVSGTTIAGPRPQGSHCGYGPTTSSSDLCPTRTSTDTPSVYPSPLDPELEWFYD